jgi:hypothetical protein
MSTYYVRTLFYVTGSFVDPQILHPWIQLTTDEKYSKRGWGCSTCLAAARLWVLSPVL